MSTQHTLAGQKSQIVTNTKKSKQICTQQNIKQSNHEYLTSVFNTTCAKMNVKDMKTGYEQQYKTKSHEVVLTLMKQNTIEDNCFKITSKQSRNRK